MIKGSFLFSQAGTQREIYRPEYKLKAPYFLPLPVPAQSPIPSEHPWVPPSQWLFAPGSSDEAGPACPAPSQPPHHPCPGFLSQLISQPLQKWGGLQLPSTARRMPYGSSSNGGLRMPCSRQTLVGPEAPRLEQEAGGERTCKETSTVLSALPVATPTLAGSSLVFSAIHFFVASII